MSTGLATINVYDHLNDDPVATGYANRPVRGRLAGTRLRYTRVRLKETSMKFRAMSVAFSAILLSVGAAPAAADEGKDESGKGKQRAEERKRYEGNSSYFHQRGHNRIPNGHLPPPGECRIWYPDRSAGHQPPPFKCGQARGQVEPGGWLISPGPQPQEVEVVVYDQRRPGIVIDVGIFDARTGSFVRIGASR